ncbi:exostosin-2 [Thozetella sp. PMI_491]|nr:exostosin-2 [Thozetella sp. PMI_491]
MTSSRESEGLDARSSVSILLAAPLTEDFTGRIVVQTYERPEELNKTLQILTDTKIPSLYEIVVVWNNVGTGPPEDYVTAHNVGVRYRASERNSLNEKLRPDPGYNTQAVLLSDDDVYYEPSDLDFVFQTWRKYGRNRITGAFARCVVANPDGGGYWYDFCRSQPHYSLVLTGLAFIHVSFLDYYHSDDALMTKIRDHVEKVFNCEDIALNFIAAMLTCEGPLQITGAKPAVNRDPPVGLSRNAPHMSVRLECINLFPSMFGYMPLFNTTERIVLGVLPTG